MGNQRETDQTPEEKLSKLSDTQKKLNDTQKKAVKYGGIVLGIPPILSGIYLFFKEKLGADMLPFFQSSVMAFIMPIVIITLLALIIVSIFDHFSIVTALKRKIAKLEPSKTHVTKLEAQVSELEKFKKQAEELGLQVTALTQERDQCLAQEKTNQKKSDSIMDMLTYANDNKQYSEVIKIGTSVSDVLWSTSRKELRIKVGTMVAAAAFEVAAMSTNETDIDYANRIRAKTLIEDIGNTKMCLHENNISDAIIAIQDGLELAREHSYFYEAVRGYRNLANCYALKARICKKNPQYGQAKEELVHAQENVMYAEEIIPSISDENKQAEAHFDVEYAKAKIQKESDKPDEAVKFLENCIKIYKDEQDKDETVKRIYADRLVKIYREMGIIYMSIPGRQKAARNAFKTGLQHAKDRQNHEDIVRCCTHLIELQLQHRFADTANLVEHWINEGESNLNMVDTQKHIDDFKNAKHKWMNKGNGNK